jgi:hypothetical protein
MIVPKILLEGSWQADLSIIPEKYRDRVSTLYRSETDDYLVTIQETEEEKQEKEKSIKATVQLIAAERILNDHIPTERVDEFAKSFHYPVSGETYKLDWILLDVKTDKLFKVKVPEVTWEKWWDMSKILDIVTPVRTENFIIPWDADITAQKDLIYSFSGKNYLCLETHVTVAGQNPTKAKTLWTEQK